MKEKVRLYLLTPTVIRTKGTLQSVAAERSLGAAISQPRPLLGPLGSGRAIGQVLVEGTIDLRSRQPHRARLTLARPELLLRTYNTVHVCRYVVKCRGPRGGLRSVADFCPAGRLIYSRVDIYSELRGVLCTTATVTVRAW